MLKGKQKKLDKNKDGKISGEDFKMMKAKYGKMMKASEGKSAKTFEELQKFGVTTKKSPEENGLKEALDRELRRAEAKQKLQRKPSLTDKQRTELRSGKIPKDLGQLKGEVSEKELSRLQNLAEKKSKGGVTKAKYGKMMKASEGSMTFSEGPTNKVRGTGIAVRGTNFKGIF